MHFTLDTGNTAWILISATLVLLMTTPALAFFYGGMVRTKSVLNMMMMSFSAAGIVSVIWVLWGYSMSFGPDMGGVIGNPFSLFGLSSLTDGDPSNVLAANGVPAFAWVAFQATFAIITVALISGAIADRMRFGSWVGFVAVWVTAVYFPLAHMVWGGGLLSSNGPIASALSTPMDFAGGAVVHIDAGIAGLVLALMLGKRKGFGSEAIRPHNLPFVMLGAGLLWVGWFGFNAGSAGAANAQAGLAWVNTLAATGAAMIGWLITERIRDGHATSLGAASGVVAGLVVITPAAGYVDPIGAVLMGLIGGAVCAMAISLKYKFGFDDSLDVVGVHLVGGLSGTVLLGLFATSDGLVKGSKAGLFYGGGFTQLLTQIIVAVAAMAFSGVLTWVVASIIKLFGDIRVPIEDEVAGVDLTTHGETAYEAPTGTGRITEVRS